MSAHHDAVDGPWEVCVGLELHVQLATASKIFSAAPVRDPQPDASAVNIAIDPYSLGLPGTLPTLNQGAVELGVRAALVFACQVHLTSRFDRKNYFYHDLPKGYQITQHAQPLASSGCVAFACDDQPRTCRIRRAHLEEDTARSVVRDGMILLDFDRAGVGLLEIVTEPDLRSAAEAAACMRAIHEALVFAGVTRGNLEAGHLRCDANVSVRPSSSPASLGVAVELKNLNSFRFVQAAIDAEVDRQTALLASGGAVARETRAWDRHRARTVLLRRKEELADYRFFPEPDLPPLVLERAWIDAIREALPPSADAVRTRYRELGLRADEVDVLTQSPELVRFFDATVEVCRAPAQQVARFILNTYLGLLHAHSAAPESFGVSPAQLAEVVEHLAERIVSQAMAPRVLLALRDGASLAMIVARKGLDTPPNESDILEVLQAVLKNESDAMRRYRGGEKKLVRYLMGRSMRTLADRADPQTVRKLLLGLLDA